MGVMVAYALLAIVLLVLGAGLFTPKRWRELPEKHLKLLKFGCLFGALLIFLRIVNAVMQKLS